MKLRKLFKRTIIFQAAVLYCVGSIYAQTNDSTSLPAWVSFRGGQKIPAGAFQAGSENNQPLYLCRAKYQGGTHPGKIVNGVCHITYGGKALQIADAEIVTGLNGAWSAPKDGGAQPFAVGSENNQPLYLCQADYQGGTHPGKVVNNACHIGWGADEILVAQYKVFYPAAAAADDLTGEAVYRKALAEAYLQKDPSEYRGRALAKYVDSFGDGAQRKPWQQVEPIFLARFAELAAVDFYAAFLAYLHIVRYTTEELNATLTKLPSEQQAAVKKAARWYSDGWNARQNKSTLPPYPADVPPPGFGWGKSVSSNTPPAGSSAPNPNQSQTTAANSANAFFKLAIEQFDRKDFDGAARSFSECLRLHPQKFLCYSGRAVTFYVLKDYDRAIADFTQYLKSAPNNADAHARRAKAYYAKGEDARSDGKFDRASYDAAIADFDAVLKIQPDNAEVKTAVEQLKKFVALNEQLAEQKNKAKNTSAVFYILGNGNFNQGKYDEAISEYTKCIRADPNADDCYTERAASLIEKSRRERLTPEELTKFDGVNVINKNRRAALDDVNRAIQINPESARGYMQRAEIYRLEEIYDKALADYRQILAVEPNLATTNAPLYKYYVEGIPKLEKRHAANLAAKGNDALLRASYLLLAKDEAGADKVYGQAIEFFTESIRLDKTNGFAWFGRGKTHELRKNYDAALADYTEALKIKPDDANTLVARASIYAEQKKTALALADFDRVIAQPPNSDKLLLDDALVGRGRLHLEANKLDAAIADFSRVIAENVNYVMAYFYRGQAHARKKNKPQAIADFREALAIAPDFADAKAELKKLGVAP